MSPHRILYVFTGVIKIAVMLQMKTASIHVEIINILQQKIARSDKKTFFYRKIN